MTIFVTLQIIVTLDSIRNSCDVYTLLTDNQRDWLTEIFPVYFPLD